MPEKNIRPSFELSVDTRLIYQEAVKFKVGDIITYEAVAKIVGRPVDGSFGPLQSALRRARKNEGMEFGSITGVGYKVLSDEEIVASSTRDIERHHRGARRAARKLANVRAFDGLTKESQAKHNAALSIFGVIGAVSTVGAVKKVEIATASAQRELPMAQTLKALGIAGASA